MGGGGGEGLLAGHADVLDVPCGGRGGRGARFLSATNPDKKICLAQINFFVWQLSIIDLLPPRQIFLSGQGCISEVFK